MGGWGNLHLASKLFLSSNDALNTFHINTFWNSMTLWPFYGTQFNWWVGSDLFVVCFCSTVLLTLFDRWLQIFFNIFLDIYKGFFPSFPHSCTHRWHQAMQRAGLTIESNLGFHVLPKTTLIWEHKKVNCPVISGQPALPPETQLHWPFYVPCKTLLKL